MSEKSASRQTGEKVIFEAFKVLKENGGEMLGRDVMSQIKERIELTEKEKEPYAKSGYIRWQSILHFHTIDCVKAGYMRKNKGVWILTEEGEKAMKLGSENLLESAIQEYKKWKEKQPPKEGPLSSEDNQAETEEQEQEAFLNSIEEQALEGLRDHLNERSPYEFQDMVAGLLRAMEYHTPFVSPRGKDGGIDVIAYQDPLGAKPPRIKVQVKHMPSTKISVGDVRELTGLLNKDGEIGLFVTSGAFSSEAQRYARETHLHVKLIDFGEFISLWQEFYSELDEEIKNLLPLKPIYFLGLNE